MRLGPVKKGQNIMKGQNILVYVELLWWDPNVVSWSFRGVSYTVQVIYIKDRTDNSTYCQNGL